MSNPKKFWSRAQWTSKTASAKEKLRIWLVIGGRSTDPQKRNLVVRNRKTGVQIAPLSPKWVDAEKLSKFVDSGH